MKVTIETEQATTDSVAKATVTEESLNPVVWIRQPHGWTTKTGWPASDELGRFLDYSMGISRATGEPYPEDRAF